MKSESWIKMGFKILKLSLICLLIIVVFYSNDSIDDSYLLEEFQFSEKLGVSSVIIKSEEEKPKQVVVSNNINVRSVPESPCLCRPWF